MSNIFHKEDFSKVLAKHGMILQEHQLRQFEEYASMLIEWNQKINLTAITDPDEIYEKHFLPYCLPLICRYRAASVMSGRGQVFREYL